MAGSLDRVTLLTKHLSLMLEPMKLRRSTGYARLCKLIFCRRPQEAALQEYLQAAGTNASRGT